MITKSLFTKTKNFVIGVGAKSQGFVTHGNIADLSSIVHDAQGVGSLFFAAAESVIPEADITPFPSGILHRIEWVVDHALDLVKIFTGNPFGAAESQMTVIATKWGITL